jgi:hypothetical protein
MCLEISLYLSLESGHSEYCPEHDHRLREHETDRPYEARHRSDDSRGRVTDPEDDRRLRANRGRGVSMSGYGGSGRYEHEEEDDDYRGRSPSRYEDDDSDRDYRRQSRGR